MNKKAQKDDFPVIGQNVHRERVRKEWTLQELATNSGLSKAMLSQIESNHVNPTIATLWKIAQALQIDLEQLISGNDSAAKKFEVTAKEHQLHLTMDEGNTVFTILSSPHQVNDLEIYRVILKPAGVHFSTPHSKNTIEYLNVIRGDVQVTAGEQDSTLKEGDFIMVQVDVNHSLKNISDCEAELFMIVRFAK